jgi:glycosyltransferase involved in cell wall biosynthesis
MMHSKSIPFGGRRYGFMASSRPLSGPKNGKTKRKSMSSVYIIGNFGYETGHLDGQTMESRSMRALLELKGIDDFTFFDTERLHSNWLSVITMFRLLWNTERLFYLGGQANLAYLFPLLWVISKIRRIEFHYFVVGGWIAEFLRNKPIHRWMLHRIEGMYCETSSICKKLRDWHGYKNTDWFPNFRISDFQPVITTNDGFPLRLVFMARLVPSKGYPLVFELADRIQAEWGGDKVTIDFYGPLYKEHEREFLRGVKKHSFLRYGGVLQPDVINETLHRYDAMLFPTSYPGEGVPGTIVDSYISGIPVIASDWRYNSEIVDDGSTGLIFDLKMPDQLFRAVERLLKDRRLLLEMKKNAHSKSHEFGHEHAWRIVKEKTGLSQSG